MNLSILHISDLHRDRNNPIRNDILFDSLDNDRRHFSEEEEPRVRTPDLIVVSGDIIQGISSDVPNPDEYLREQYSEASNFLIQLADRFVGGDRQRVIIVPGNHDVSAFHLKNSVELVNVLPDRKKELINQLFSSESPLRWSWRELKLYKIVDPGVYKQRMAAFAQFYSDFYNGERTYDLDPARQLDIFDYPCFDLTVVGFSSCYNNDLYNRQGAIHPGCIAEAGARLRHRSFARRLRMAVWHHDTEGPPGRSDYMDADLLQNLIDRGFSVGLHGHQHRPQYLDTRFRHGIERKMTVISAGTLCGGPNFRHGRAYNVVELHTGDRTGRLHVREMQNDDFRLPIWGRRTLPPNILPYYDFEYEAPPPPPTNMNNVTTLLNEAQNLHMSGEYRSAADLLVTVVGEDDLGRQLLLDCLVQLRDTRAVLEMFDPPDSGAEAIHVMDALWDTRRLERLAEIIGVPPIADSTDPSVVEIRSKYSARLK